ncbi:MAG: 16S rRNA (uracil(1498)-N(3))-methyltransferase [Xanthomonadales bacterium]|nr:16S rRNA (uracil(1498)-N(3))-methyltransferase [Xanthomonadales bacterium]
MRLTRVHLDGPLSVGGSVELPKSVAQHLLKVLRLRPGAAVVLFNGDGNQYHGILEDNRSVRVEREETGIVPSPLRLTLAQGLCRGEKMDLVLQKATELGVAEVQPLITQRSEVRLSGERLQRRMTHWQQVIASACEQCGRAELPALHSPIPLPEWLSQLPAADQQIRLILDPDGDTRLSELAPDLEVIGLVGPEGGFEEREVQLCASQGFFRLTLGPRVLRTETAGPALLAALGALRGDLG